MVLEVEEKPELKGQKKFKNTKEALKWTPKSCLTASILSNKYKCINLTLKRKAYLSQDQNKSQAFYKNMQLK